METALLTSPAPHADALPQVTAWVTREASADEHLRLKHIVREARADALRYGVLAAIALAFALAVAWAGDFTMMILIGLVMGTFTGATAWVQYRLATRTSADLVRARVRCAIRPVIDARAKGHGTMLITRTDRFSTPIHPPAHVLHPDVDGWDRVLAELVVGETGGALLSATRLRTLDSAEWTAAARA